MENCIAHLTNSLISKDSDIGGAGKSDLFKSALAVVREHLGLDVTYISEITDRNMIYHHVCDPAGQRDKDSPRLRPGDMLAKQKTYCHHVSAGTLPELIRNTQDYELARDIPATRELNIAAHIGVPIQLKDGHIYGMMCGFSHTPNESLNERDLSTMRIFANLVGEHLDERIRTEAIIDTKRRRVRDVLDSGSLDVAFQPIVNLTSMLTVGYEALSRFSGPGACPPDILFAEADDVGYLAELELTAIDKALRAMPKLAPTQFLSINASPSTILTEDFLRLLTKYPLQRIVVEVTEHAQVGCYDQLATALAPLRRQGTRLAVDDAGAGYASMRHILQLHPDIIKLDMSITRDLDRSPSHRALVRALTSFTLETRGHVVAEGIENDSELTILRELGVHKGQGYLLGRPSLSLPDVPQESVRLRA
jgi:EAL domain-containing protein (putative c-di-GMP-specific phosphodiesterase class I)